MPAGRDSRASTVPIPGSPRGGAQKGSGGKAQGGMDLGS